MHGYHSSWLDDVMKDTSSEVTTKKEWAQR